MQRVLLGLSAISTGLLTGAMLFIGLSVAPWLRSLPPAEFHTWVLSYGPTIWRAILPMGALSIILALATLVFSRGYSVACRRLLMVAAACLVGGAVVHSGGNVPTSAALVGSLILSKKEEAALLGREIFWHWLRVLLGLAAFLATLSAFRLREKELEGHVQRERLDRLKRFFSPHVADLIVGGGGESPLRTHRREVTVVFLDLRGFTAFAETAEPEEVMGVLTSTTPRWAGSSSPGRGLWSGLRATA